MTKEKFEWNFVLTENKQFLQVFVNNHMKKVLDIKHESYIKNLNDVLLEIIAADKVHGIETTIISLKAIEQVKEIIKKVGAK